MTLISQAHNFHDFSGLERYVLRFIVLYSVAASKQVSVLVEYY